MADTAVEPRVADSGLDSVAHLCCCLDTVEVGEPTRSFCGKVEPYDGYVFGDFAVDPDTCVVCMDLALAGCCPLRARCVDL